MTCVTAAAAPNLRGEGYTEPVGDITLSCTGGFAGEIGDPVNRMNLTIVFNTAVTSRILPQTNVSNAISDSLLLIDEPGSGLPPLVPNFGAGAGQNLCATPLTGCLEYISQALGSSVKVATDTPQGTTATTAGKNVFQGVVNGNSITYFGIPVVPAETNGPRIFRITNVRVDATQLAGAPSSGPAVPVVASVTGVPGGFLAITRGNPVVGFVTSGLSAGVAGSTSQDQCTAQTKSLAGTLAFTETFGAAFKTRVFAQSNLPYAGQKGLPEAAAQSIPGAVFNSESGLVLPVATGQVAGLSDFGTRLKAVFNNVPSGVHLFVSTANVQNNGLPVSVPAVIGGVAANNSPTGFAQLTSDESGPFNAVASTTFAPGNLGSVPLVEIPVSNGSATAVWEVINTNPNAAPGTLNFGVYVSYTANGPYPPLGTTSVNLSYGPTPPTFTAANGGSASDMLPIPRFVPDATSARSIFTMVAGTCSGSATVATTSTALSLSGANPYTLTATVSTPSPGTTGAPVGSVTFYDAGVIIPGSTTALNSSAIATFTTSLPNGPHRLSAIFTPANSQAFSASTSPDVVLSPGRTATSMEITSNLYPSLPGQAVTFTAAVTGATASLTGVVQFSDGLQSLGTASLAGGRASVTSTLTVVGVHNIFAAYSGDGSNGDSSARFGQRVDRLADSLSLTATGQNLTATLAPQPPTGVPAATGTVQFQEGSTVVGTATLTASSATLSIASLAPGPHQIFAVYGGDANWYGAHSPTINVIVVVTTLPTTGVLTSSATISEVRLALALTPSASGGTVQFVDTTTNATLGSTQPVNGIATLALSPADAAIAAGHGIPAIYSGAAGFSGSTSNTLVLPGLRNAAAGMSAAFAPDELVSLYGAKLVDAAEPSVATALPLSLGGLAVNLTDSTGAVLPAGLSYVSPSQVNFLIPASLARGGALVTVLRSGTVIAAIPISIARVAPGLFGSQVLHADNGDVYLLLYGTGLRNRSDNSAVTCMVNGTPVAVAFSGAQSAFPGLDQVNVLVPANLRTGSLSVSLMVDGQASNAITVAMQ